MIHVCDNFFEDPFEIREVALQSEYNCNTDRFLLTGERGWV